MSKSHILIVEDETISQAILKEILKNAGFQLTITDTGTKAWELLATNLLEFDAILLDLNLPDMHGIDLLNLIKSKPSRKRMPIIVQTSMTSQEEVQSCLEAGAYYYLTKPFNAGILIAVVNTAIQDYHDYQQLQEETKHTSSVLSKITYARFNFQTPAEAREIATYIVKSCQEEHNVVLGLSELMLNAVEHGNLGITYQEKSQLLKEGLWHEEIYKRLIDPSNAKKNATVTFERDEFEIRFIIRDEGNGFDWRNYLEMKPERALDLHGRGIVLAGTISFDKLEYNEVGNEVIATIYCE